jgi:hypothetical protein
MTSAPGIPLPCNWSIYGLTKIRDFVYLHRSGVKLLLSWSPSEEIATSPLFSLRWSENIVPGANLNVNEEDECSICREILVFGKTLETRCGHKFCISCYKKLTPIYQDVGITPSMKIEHAKEGFYQCQPASCPICRATNFFVRNLPVPFEMMEGLNVNPPNIIEQVLRKTAVYKPLPSSLEFDDDLCPKFTDESLEEIERLLSVGFSVQIHECSPVKTLPQNLTTPGEKKTLSEINIRDIKNFFLDFVDDYDSKIDGLFPPLPVANTDSNPNPENKCIWGGDFKTSTTRWRGHSPFFDILDRETEIEGIEDFYIMNEKCKEQLQTPKNSGTGTNTNARSKILQKYVPSKGKFGIASPTISFLPTEVVFPQVSEGVTNNEYAGWPVQNNLPTRNRQDLQEPRGIRVVDVSGLSRTPAAPPPQMPRYFAQRPTDDWDSPAPDVERRLSPEMRQTTPQRPASLDNW